MTMLHASACAREGDQAYFEKLNDHDWTLLLGSKDEDGRCLLHSAVSHPALVDTIVSHGKLVDRLASIVP